MKAKFITFVRGLMNGTPPRFQSYLKSLTILLGLMLSVNVWGVDKTVSWTAAKNALGSAISSVGGSASGTIKTGDFEWSYTRTLSSLKSSKSDYVAMNGEYMQLGSSNAGESITFTTSNIPGTIKSVNVLCGGSSHTGSIKVGTTSYKSGNIPSWNGSTQSGSTYGGTGTASGTITITFSVSSNAALYIKTITVVYDEAASSKTLSSIAVTKQPSKKTYTTCDKLDLTGREVTATYSDNSTEDVTTECTFSPENGAALTTDVTSVSVSYGGKETTITGISVTEGASDTYIDNVHNSEISGDFSCSYKAPALQDKQKGATESCEDTHYHFVGWVEEGTTPTQSPSNVIPAGTEMTGSNKTYKAVWAKEAE